MFEVSSDEEEPVPSSLPKTNQPEPSEPSSPLGESLVLLEFLYASHIIAQQGPRRSTRNSTSRNPASTGECFTIT